MNFGPSSLPRALVTSGLALLTLLLATPRHGWAQG